MHLREVVIDRLVVNHDDIAQRTRRPGAAICANDFVSHLFAQRRAPATWAAAEMVILRAAAQAVRHV